MKSRLQAFCVSYDNLYDVMRQCNWYRIVCTPSEKVEENSWDFLAAAANERELYDCIDSIIVRMGFGRSQASEQHDSYTRAAKMGQGKLNLDSMKSCSNGRIEGCADS